MIPEIPLLASFALLMAVGPYWFFRRTGRRYLVWDVGSWLAIGALIGGAGSIGIAIAPSLLLAVVIGTKLAVFAIALVLLGREEERWSANAAALFSLAVFLLVGTESLQWPLDGDEAYYVLVAESILRDGDLDLRNQYAALERSITGRLDLGPQAGDPVGPGGEAYSRNEPLLSLLLVPGIALAGVWGAMATMALCGALLVRALLLLLEESGAARSTLVRLWPLLAFGSPLLFYSMRVWPEVPAALCLTEAIRCAARRRAVAMLPWLVAMSLLQVRFLVVAATFGALAFARMRPSRRVVAVALLAIVIPLALA
ncbi:MAG TPA: hypothetical protein VMS56_02030, partial [Thermoanaerobaculia bacterium]|nr:hypothetical protein [Thermoanaerobaculia bacterium]